MASPFAVALHRNTFACAHNEIVEVFRIAENLATFSLGVFQVSSPPELLIAHEDAVIGYDGDHESAWLWTVGQSPREFARRTTVRDTFGFGFVQHGKDTLVISNRDGKLRIETLDGKHLNDVEVRAPNSFLGFRFIELPQEQVGIIGRTFGDYSYTAIAVPLASLVQDARSVQDALTGGSVLADRAPSLAIGCCGENVIVYRDPEEDEPIEPDAFDVPDVFGFRGFYERDLSTGALGAMLPYAQSLPGASKIFGSATTIAVQTAAGVKVIDRATGSTQDVGGQASALDDLSGRIAVLTEEGAWTIRPLV